ncbi:MAG: tRNA dihydrouridine synthase DusB [Christensenellaceae bacterium]
MNKKIFLAPLAGITDSAMREVCIDCGAQMTYTEMISAKGIAYKNARTHELLVLSDKEAKVGVQIFGNDPDIMADTAKNVQDMLQERLYCIDINMGCPAPKIVNNGEGSALMKNLPLASKIIASVKKSIDVPLSVKFRKGFDETSINGVEFGCMAQDSGADIVTIHGRTRKQYYSGKADMEIIRQIKQAVHIKVIGNGDIFTPQDAKKMFEYTGCDGVMVARGAIGNPFIFTQIAEYLKTGEIKTYPTQEDRIKMCLRQAQLTVKNKGEQQAIKQMRTHASHYIKGMKDAAKIRTKVVLANTYDELEEILRGFLQK